MKYSTRNHHYKNSTGNNIVQFDDKHRLLFASSYVWYKYIKTFINPITGKNFTVFNRTAYSPTTCAHIRNALKVLNYPDFHLTLDGVYSSLDCLSLVIDDLQSQIETLVKTIKKPGTHKDKNEKREVEIVKLQRQISILKELIS